ncbi:MULTISPECIES: hypothetical protein [Anaerolinea]|uniref:Uncharacterized protein n=1 Tax=Anaerolinea thermophila (strain DSM 14523 / JCM 11388 / NBRC 100420 / UNI-1) TaxID=926569 RepID=E8N5Q1_ANATU|nr:MULTISPECIES: hypothetical protein [Anaerolinea]BAJ63765.1 hypothetical protein ANT_17390 [Anaerolinea thermophila UNI-1]
MDTHLLSKICKEVYRQFPEVAGIAPKITERPDGHLLVFKGNAITADGRKLLRTVRAVVNHQGKITKLTTSK